MMGTMIMMTTMCLVLSHSVPGLRRLARRPMRESTHQRPNLWKSPCMCQTLPEFQKSARKSKTRENAAATKKALRSCGTSTMPRKIRAICFRMMDAGATATTLRPKKNVKIDAGLARCTTARKTPDFPECAS
uniref:Secreted protein n=1 Tax=Ixodes ricinus TaxID=34613 RepID=A0A6B0UR98_IXORI